MQKVVEGNTALMCLWQYAKADAMEAHKQIQSSSAPRWLMCLPRLLMFFYFCLPTADCFCLSPATLLLLLGIINISSRRQQSRLQSFPSFFHLVFIFLFGRQQFGLPDWSLASLVCGHRTLDSRCCSRQLSPFFSFQTGQKKSRQRRDYPCVLARPVVVNMSAPAVAILTSTDALRHCPISGQLIRLNCCLHLRYCCCG